MVNVVRCLKMFYFGLLLHLSYLIITDSACNFLSSETGVNDANSVTVAIDSSFLGVQNSLLIIIIIIFVNCYCYYL